MKRCLAALLVATGCHAAMNEPPPGVDAPATAGDWTALVARSWSIAPGATNIYRCTRIQVPQEMWISGFRALSPAGTHHEVVTIDPTDTSTGDYNCSVGSGTLTGQMLYAAGVNTDDLVFPAGVGVHLAAGTWINLNLHLFNASDATLAGDSGILVKPVDPATIVHEVDMTFAGTTQFSIPADGQPHTAMGGCTTSSDLHLFALWPHMHQIATHQLVTTTHAGAILDTAYSFSEQRNYPMAELVVPAGDRIETTCTYVNTTAAPVAFGDSSTAEMCFTGLYKYPAGGGSLGCVDH